MRKSTIDRLSALSFLFAKNAEYRAIAHIRKHRRKDSANVGPLVGPIRGYSYVDESGESLDAPGLYPDKDSANRAIRRIPKDKRLGIVPIRAIDHSTNPPTDHGFTIGRILRDKLHPDYVWPMAMQSAIFHPIISRVDGRIVSAQMESFTIPNVGTFANNRTGYAEAYNACKSLIRDKGPKGTPKPVWYVQIGQSSVVKIPNRSGILRYLERFADSSDSVMIVSESSGMADTYDSVPDAIRAIVQTRKRTTLETIHADMDQTASTPIELASILHNKAKYLPNILRAMIIRKMPRLGIGNRRAMGKLGNIARKIQPNQTLIDDAVSQALVLAFDRVERPWQALERKGFGGFVTIIRPAFNKPGEPIHIMPYLSGMAGSGLRIALSRANRVPRRKVSVGLGERQYTIRPDGTLIRHKRESVETFYKGPVDMVSTDRGFRLIGDDGKPTHAIPSLGIRGSTVRDTFIREADSRMDNESERVWNRLSPLQRSIMLQAPNSRSMADIAKRLQIDPSQVSRECDKIRTIRKQVCG